MLTVTRDELGNAARIRDIESGKTLAALKFPVLRVLVVSENNTLRIGNVYDGDEIAALEIPGGKITFAGFLSAKEVITVDITHLERGGWR